MRIAVFGYGSLVNKDSLEKTLGKNIKIQTAILKGWKRDWSAILENTSNGSHYQLSGGEVPPKVVVLNIRQSEGSEVNGVLIDCSEKKLDRLINREVHYDLVDVTQNVSCKGFDKVYSFSAKIRFLGNGTEAAIIPLSYKVLVESAFRLISDNELSKYLNTTESPKYKIVESTFIDASS